MKNDSDIKGLLVPGNIDLYHRPVVHNLDGSISTVRSMSFEMDGKQVLVPTVSNEGTLMSNDEAIKYYQKTRQHLGIFDTVDNANTYATQLHNQQDKFYNNTPVKQSLPTDFPQYNPALDYKAPSIGDVSLVHNDVTFPSNASYQNRDLFQLLKGLSDTRLEMDKNLNQQGLTNQE